MKVLQPFPFVDGTPLATDEWNPTLYTTEQARGLYSEVNGGLTEDNLSTDFRLRQEHLQPEQVIKSRFSGAFTALDNMSDVSGRSSAAVDTSAPKRQALPGCGLRVYAPFNATAIRWNFSWFWHAARWFGLTTGTPDAAELQALRTHVFVDGVEVVALRRQYPLTWFKKTPGSYTAASAANDNQAPWSTEAVQASQMNLSHLQVASTPGNPSLKLAKGFHEAYVGFYVKPLNDVYFYRETLRKSDNSADMTAEKVLEMYQRLSVGCRSARVVAYR
mgnify:FL=1|tara:strand:+ start:6550 stop:7374 length:825 start_codon:yes stop_codon:yes gene_type:complete